VVLWTIELLKRLPLIGQAPGAPSIENPGLPSVLSVLIALCAETVEGRLTQRIAASARRV
jgi:hypothetical protein